VERSQFRSPIDRLIKVVGVEFDLYFETEMPDEPSRRVHAVADEHRGLHFVDDPREVPPRRWIVRLLLESHPRCRTMMTRNRFFRGSSIVVGPGVRDSASGISRVSSGRSAPATAEGYVYCGEVRQVRSGA
jgi:hypothetical protein